MFKGTLIHEILHLPKFWLNISKVDKGSPVVSKHKFGKQHRQYYLKVKEGKNAHACQIGRETRSLGRAPNTQEANSKIVFYFHGGGWMFGTPEQFLQNAIVFTQMGYTVYMPSYRRLPYYNMKAIRADLLAGIEHISKNSPEPVTEVVLAGMSAGGHLAALLALDEKIQWQKTFGLPIPQKYIGIGSPLDLGEMYTPVVRRLAGRKNSAEFQASNPAVFLKSLPSIEMFILSAGYDGLVPYRAKSGFVKMAKSAGLNIIHHHFEAATHLEIAHWSIPGSKYYEVIMAYLRSSTDLKKPYL